jgi:hypothetical protein
VSLLIVLFLLTPTLLVERGRVSRAAGGTSIRFYGTGTADQDRIKIALADGASARPVNLGSDLTLEFWLRAAAAANSAPACDEWYYGNIIIDRDVDGPGDYGDYGVALCEGRLVFGVAVGEEDPVATGATDVTDGQWHHVALTRNSTSGALRIFVDGQLDGQASGPSGRIDYRVGRATQRPESDPFLVLGAEKHDYSESRSYSGLLDDLRLSNTVRYTQAFSRPTAPHSADASTVALYRFDEGTGTTVGDSASGGASGGVLKPRVGGAAQHWSTDTPFTSAAPTPTASATASGTATTTGTATATGTATIAPPGADPTAEPTAGPTASPAPPSRCGAARSESRLSGASAALTGAAPLTTTLPPRLFVALLLCTAL